MSRVDNPIDKSKKNRPYAGVGVFVVRGGKFLVIQRKGSFAAGAWALPGGKIDFGEEPDQAAKREVMEETGCEIGSVRFCAVTNDIFVEEGRHFISWWLVTDWIANEPDIKEPGKCSALKWVDFDSIPEPRFLPFDNLFKSQFFDNVKTLIGGDL